MVNTNLGKVIQTRPRRALSSITIIVIVQHHKSHNYKSMGRCLAIKLWKSQNLPAAKLSHFTIIFLQNTPPVTKPTDNKEVTPCPHQFILLLSWGSKTSRMHGWVRCAHDGHPVVPSMGAILAFKFVDICRHQSTAKSIPTAPITPRPLTRTTLHYLGRWLACSTFPGQSCCTDPSTTVHASQHGHQERTRHSHSIYPITTCSTVSKTAP